MPDEAFFGVEQRPMLGKVIVFGSRARGDHLKDSDYDIIVVSRLFQGYSFLDRLAMLYELWDGHLHLDILAYTPEEFEQKKAESGIVAKRQQEWPNTALLCYA